MRVYLTDVDEVMELRAAGARIWYDLRRESYPNIPWIYSIHGVRRDGPDSSARLFARDCVGTGDLYIEVDDRDEQQEDETGADNS